MALKVKFDCGIESMSGTMKHKDGTCITFTHRRGDKPGEGHARIWQKGMYKRSTKVQPEEIARREIFSLRSKRVAELMATKGISRKEAWGKVKGELKNEE